MRASARARVPRPLLPCGAILAGVVVAGGCFGAPAAQDLAPPAAVSAAQTEEFVGPFPSWTDVKAVHGAVGDGVADDTAALQRALAQAGDRDSRSPVVYLPAGRYRITATLTLQARENVSVLGEDPATVTLVWDGPKDGTMLDVNGVAYSKISRLALDGRGTAAVAIEQSWDGRTGAFDTGNEYSDLRLSGVAYGIRGGFRGYGFAETSILRTVFDRSRQAGVALGNFNALDIWIWDSFFDRCTVGVTNDPGAGNYRVYGSVFRGSAVADLVIQNTGVFSARGNYSQGSKAFFVSGRPLNHPALISIQGNTIVDARDSAPIRLSNQGPGLIVDNVIRSAAGAQVSPVFWKSPMGADVASVGNTFTVPYPPDVNGRLLVVDDRTVAPASLSALAAPALPGTPPNRRRPIVEVPANADTDRIQQAIDSAMTHRGERPVVHLPFGTYQVTRTLVIPPGDVQLVGDGFRTRLSWAGAGEGTVLRVAGPTHATLRELRVDGGGRANGIVADGLDQPGARVFANGLQVRSSHRTGLFVDGLREAAIDLVDFGHAYASSGVSVRMNGGHATIHSGASAGNRLSYDLSGGAGLLARDLWYEGKIEDGFARVQRSATMTLEASRVASPADGPVPAIRLEDLEGRFAFVTTLIDDRVEARGGGPKADVLILGVTREFSPAPLFDAPVPSAGSVTLLNNRRRLREQGLLSAGTEALPDRAADAAGALRRLLADTRRVVLPPVLDARPDDVSDLRFFRVLADSGLDNLRVTAR